MIFFDIKQLLGTKTSRWLWWISGFINNSLVDDPFEASVSASKLRMRAIVLPLDFTGRLPRIRTCTRRARKPCIRR